MDATTPESAYLQRLRTCLTEGAGKGFRSGIRLLAIIIPVSFIVMLLSWSGVLRWIAQWMAPLFGCIGLPGEAALAFITGAFINLYAGIAAMSAITLTARQLTILAVVCLISHNLPVEVAVQHKAGSSGPRLLIMRLLTSAAAGFLLHRTMPAGPSEPVITSVLAAGPRDFMEALAKWGVDAGYLAAKVLLIIVALMVLLRILTEFGLIQLLSRPLWPVLAVLGLSRSTAFLWIVANTLGLAYGAGVILEEVRTGMIEKRDVDLLNHSIAVCHSLLEDTLLFVAIGAWWIWLILPRLLFAAVVVWLKRWEARWRKPAPENDTARPSH